MDSEREERKMGLLEQLNEDLKEALRAQDQLRKDTIRMVKAAIRNAEVERGRALEEGEILEIIAKQVKLRREALADFHRGGRHDLVRQYEGEVTILEGYLPRQMSREEIVQAAREVIAELGAEGPRAVGPVMRELMQRLRGRADGKVVNEVVKELLAG
ncbi:MAG: GatB/YqeY domain-containing protein [Anaerolineae bacterium]